MVPFITISMFLCISYILYCELKNFESIVLTGGRYIRDMVIVAFPMSYAVVDYWMCFHRFLGFVAWLVGYNCRISHDV